MGFETTPARGGVLTPGLPILPHGTERHPVPGGGSRAVPIFAGDAITVVDREGLQPVELVFFAADGRSDASMIGAVGGGAAAGLQRALAADALGRAVLKALDAAGFDVGRADATRVFAKGSRAGEAAEFTAAHDGLLTRLRAGGADAARRAGHSDRGRAVRAAREPRPGEGRSGLRRTRWPIRCSISTSCRARREAMRLGRAVHPDPRRAGPAVLGLPGLRAARARAGG